MRIPITPFVFILFLLPSTDIQARITHASADSFTNKGRTSVVVNLISSPDTSNILINHDSTDQVQNEEQIVVNPTDGDNLVAIWRDFRLGYRRVGIGYTLDGGQTWFDTLLVDPHYPRQSDPALTVDAEGNFYAIVATFEWETTDGFGIAFWKSTDGGQSWSDPILVLDEPTGTTEHHTSKITCDRTGGIFHGYLYVTAARMWDYGHGEIVVARSTDGGLSFEPTIQLSDQQVPYNFIPSLAVGPDGTLYVAWLDGKPSLLIDRSTDGGVTFSTDKTISSLTTSAWTFINGGIAIYPYPTLDVDISGGPYNGYLYVAYVDYNGTDMDIFFRRSTDGGNTWSEELRLNDDPVGNGCDQFHPWLTVDRNGAINVVFYDRRNDPYNLLMDVYFTQSRDGGESFLPNQRITTISSDPTAGQVKAGILGEYIGVTAQDGHVHPVWTDTRSGNQDVYTARVRYIFCGDANGDEVVDIADVIFLINYLFIDGPPPVPLSAADVNLDFVVDIADVIYLINYLFIEGPPPCEP